MTSLPEATSADVEGRLLGRAARITYVVAKHGLKELFTSADTDGSALSTPAAAERFRASLEELGPTFCKLGQILSTRPDLLPPAVVEELSTLQEHVAPLTESDVVSVMEQELGVPWEDVFETIDPTPLAAGTIGQVHRATLADGEKVVVKVQRPTAEADIQQDLGLLELFAEKAAGRPAFRQMVDLPAIIEHLSASLRRELDFRQEARNIARMRAALAPYSQLAVPRVHERISSSRLLVLEEIPGIPIRAAPTDGARKEAARQLLEAYYRQVLVEGFFHADPHPGNLMWWEDKIYFLDLGMVGEVEPETRELLLLLLMAFWREDAAFFSDVALMLAGEGQGDEVDLEAFTGDLEALIVRHRGSALADLQLGALLQDVTEVALRHHVVLPASLALMGKAFAQMQIATAELDPTLDPFKVAGNFVLKTLAGRIREGANPRQMLYEAQKAKVRLIRLVEAVERVTGARPGTKLQVDFRGTERLEETIRRTGQRVAVGISAGAALLGAAITATADDVAAWVPASLGSLATVLTAGVVIDFLRRDR
ncbi:MAG: AarF/UbiB family protein [Actinomycetota bacterium]|nr:AarF/UbiB family protein [Actinomycetota bacterium]